MVGRYRINKKLERRLIWMRVLTKEEDYGNHQISIELTFKSRGMILTTGATVVRTVGERRNFSLPSYLAQRSLHDSWNARTPRQWSIDRLTINGRLFLRDQFFLFKQALSHGSWTRQSSRWLKYKRCMSVPRVLVGLSRERADRGFVTFTMYTPWSFFNWIETPGRSGRRGLISSRASPCLN